MSNVKKSNNNANRIYNRTINRIYTANGESTWNTESYQQNQTNRSRQSKYYQGKNNASLNNKYYPAKEGNRDLEVSYEIDLIVQNKPENSSNLDSSPAFSPSSESNSSETPEEHDQVKTTEANNGGCYDQGLQMSQTEVNNSSVYYNNEYDYQQTSVQQQSQYYIYQPSYQEYNQCQNISGSPLNSSFTQPQTYYPNYQPLPSYIYDTQAYSQAYSPIQPTMQHTFHQTPGNNQQMSTQTNDNLSSPQPPQQPNFMASYQTPPQPSHQLYIQTSNITPPTSLSPNDTPSTNMPSSTNTERSIECQSPSPCQNIPSNLAQTPVHNPYIMQYSQEAMQGQYMTPNYTPLTPGQAYPCNSPLPTAQYMMYNPPPMLQQGCGSPYSQTGLNSPMMHTPYGNNNGQTPSKFNHKHKWNNNNNKYNKRGGFNNNQKYSYPEQTPQLGYSPEESQFMDSPVISEMPTFEFEQSLNPNDTSQMPVYPTSPYCDPSMSMPNTEAILSAAYNNYNNIESYGDEYADTYEDNGDDNDENLACQVCRGRRMCFCYFLKVRYYKFPSFFDLVDHQYKKWRKTMAQNNLMQRQQHQQQGAFMNSPIQNQGMMGQCMSPQMNTSVLGKYNENINK